MIFKSVSNDYYIKQKLVDIADNIFQLKLNAYDGIYMGIWNGIFFGIIWTISMNIFQIQNVKVLISMCAPFMMWFFIDLKFNSLGDLQNLLFMLTGSAMSGFSGIIGAMLVKDNGLGKINAADAVFGLGIGLLIGTLNTYVLLARGL